MKQTMGCRTLILIGFFMLINWLSAGKALAQENVSVINETLSFGMVKKHVIVGKSTQSEVIKIFGSPDNIIMKKGKELWIYDRFKVETSASSESGFGNIIIAGVASKTSKTSTSIKTITVMIDFDVNNVVEDFSIRVGGF